MRRILLTGVSNLANRGEEAAVLCVLRDLHAAFPDARVALLSGRPAADARWARERGADMEIVPWAGTPARRLRATFVPRPIPRALRQALSGVDLAVTLGGDIFSTYWRGSFHWHLQTALAVRGAGIPLAMLAQTIGPFSRREDAALWLEAAEGAAVLTVRDAQSLAYCTQELGMDAARVSLCADPAFLLPAAGDARMRELAAQLRLPSGGNRIAIAPSAGIAGYTGLRAREHLRAWERVLAALLDGTDAHLVLLPHVQAPWPIPDDRGPVRYLARRFAASGRVTACADLSAAEYKGIIGACGLLVAERMHAAVAGCAEGIATVLVGYSRKGLGLAELLLGGARSGLLFSAEDFTHAPDTPERILAAWHGRAEHAAGIAGRAGAAKASAARNVALLRAAFPA